MLPMQKSDHRWIAKKEISGWTGFQPCWFVSFRVRRLLLSPVWACVAFFEPRSLPFDFFVRLRMGFLKLAEVSLRLLLQHPLLARTRRCRSGFGFRSHDRHRHCRSDIDLDVAMGVAFFSLNNWMLGIEFP
jgi:hypothetical protein